MNWRRVTPSMRSTAAAMATVQDFAEDLCRVIEALDLSDIFGIGHSAGATDLLLAAKLLPKRFSRLCLHPAWLCSSERRPGTTALHA